MAERQFIRDAAGRFARSMTAAAKKAAAEEVADAKRVARARIAAEIAEANTALAAARRDLKATDQQKEDANTDSDFLDWEIARKKARDAVRRATVKIAGLKVAARAAK